MTAPAQTAADPYAISGPAMISFSGGRTSAYMLRKMLDAAGGAFAPDVHVCFANTGKEREETLRFVHECQVRWGLPIHWLEWRTRRTKDDDGKVIPFDARFEEVGYNSAARAGEPFAELIRVKGYTPNAVTRFCTSELKVRIMKWFMQARGYDRWANVVGLRHDEARRVDKMRVPNRERWTVALPLDDAGVTTDDVRRFWVGDLSYGQADELRQRHGAAALASHLPQGFDLGLLPFEGNCDGCFLKARPKLWELERTKPGSLQWWSDMEVGPGKGRFVTEYSYAELMRDVRRQPDMFAGGLFDNDPDMDAECGAWCGEAA